MKLFSSTIHQDNWKRYLRRHPLHVYQKDEIILLQEEVPRAAHVIKKGLVKVYDITNEGEERVISFDATDEIFPIGWVFGKIEKTQYFYQALTECEVYILQRNDFLRYLRLHPKMGAEMYAGLANRFVSLQGRIHALEQSKATDKIIYTLVYLCERFGKQQGAQGKVTLDVPLTQQEIANFVGLTRETTSVELKKLERQKLLTHSHKKYVINVEKLLESIL